MTPIFWSRDLAMARQPASITGEQHCNRCGVCCISSPCQLMPSDVAPMARALRVTEAELARDHLQVVRRTNGFIVTPKRVEAGAQCSLYDDANRRCTVNDAKPFGGREFACWTDSGRSVPASLWNEQQLVAFALIAPCQQ